MRFFEKSALIALENGCRDALIMPGECYELDLDIPDRGMPVTHGIRVIGEADMFWKWRQESGNPYYIGMSIEDILTTRDTPREKFAMRIVCEGETYPRNAYVKLRRGTFLPGREYRFEIFGKAENLCIGEDGEAVAELGIYRSRKGRHPDDTYDMPDLCQTLHLEPGSYDWTKFSVAFTMPADAVALLLRIGVRNADGVAMFGSARLYTDGEDNPIPALDHQQYRRPEYNYIGENLSRRDWPEFEIAVDGQPVFKGKKYTSIYRRPEFEIAAGELAPGRHKLSFKLNADYESALGFVFQRVELFEYGNHEFEILAAPEFLRADEPCRVFLKTARPGVTVNGQCFAAAGYQVLTLPPLEPGIRREVVLESENFRDSFTVKQVMTGEHDGVYLSTGDAIFVNQNPTDFMRYLEWYAGNQVGNALCFRQAYRWGGAHAVNEAGWKMIIPFLNQLGMAYTVMVDGRELPGMGANPPDSLVAGPGYRGRQAHENDGSFYYWGNKIWGTPDLNDPYADLLARGVNKGGIQPHVRPKRNGNRAWWFFDPTKAQNMKEAATDFVCNLAEARGESTRHSGPSTLFRYFFQAGYRFCSAEQMYGPEEVVLAALRGASRAYGTEQYGAHLATQWSSTPHDTPEHAERYWLSLATCYLQGVTEMNIEEGLWRMENDYADYDRFSAGCLRHLEAHTRFRRYMQTHHRRGSMRVPVAAIQGRYDGWSCFARGANVWQREGDYWKFGPPEESFDLLGVFYPRSKFGGIYRCPCPNEPQGWYTGTPYGPVDLVPCEGDWKRYRVLIFLGWHTYEAGDGTKMLEFVENGGTLLLARPHLSNTVDRNRFPRLSGEYALDALLGQGWHSAVGVIRREVGSGRVVYFADDCYPVHEQVRAEYENEMRRSAESVISEERSLGWVRAGEDVNFAVYDGKDGRRVIYLLNIRWWDRATAAVTLLLGADEYEITVEEGEIFALTIYDGAAVMTHADVESFDGKNVCLQSPDPGVMRVFRGGTVTTETYDAGRSTVALDG